MTSMLLFIPTLLIALVLGVYVLITGLFCQIAGAILDWLISPGFMSLSYTRIDGPNANPIVAMGLNITQEFVNLLLVIFLVFIALSIALKVKEYGSKKIFAKLIIIALLVNFAPVFVGLIVDAANIVMNFFLQGIGESASEIGTGVTSFGQGVTKILFSFSGNLAERGGLLMQAVTQIVVNLGMGFAFLLFAVIFLIRYVMIWVLTILSPLAFVFWILPATKKFWTLWWNQLIQWSIIGIPIAFFLYLAMNSFAVLQQAFVGQLNMPGIESTTAGWFDQVFPFFVIIVFLILGFTVGLKTGAMGSAAVIRGFQAAHITAQSRTLKAAGRGVVAATGVPAAAKAAVSAARMMQRTYKAGRALGLSPIKAGGEAVKRQWQRRTYPTIKKGATAVKEGIKHPITTTWKATKAVGKGAVAAWETEKEAVSEWGAGEEPGTRWERKIEAAKKAGQEIPKDWYAREKAAPRGFVNAFRDIVGTGWKAAVKPPKKKQGTRARKLTKGEIEKGEVEEVEKETPGEE